MYTPCRGFRVFPDKQPAKSDLCTLAILYSVHRLQLTGCLSGVLPLLVQNVYTLEGTRVTGSPQALRLGRPGDVRCRRSPPMPSHQAGPAPSNAPLQLKLSSRLYSCISLDQVPYAVLTWRRYSSR